MHGVGKFLSVDPHSIQEMLRSFISLGCVPCFGPPPTATGTAQAEKSVNLFRIVDLCQARRPANCQGYDQQLVANLDKLDTVPGREWCGSEYFKSVARQHARLLWE